MPFFILYWFRNKILNFCPMLWTRHYEYYIPAVLLPTCLFSILFLFICHLHFYSLSQFYFRSDGNVLKNRPFHLSALNLPSIYTHFPSLLFLHSRTMNRIKLLDVKNIATDSSVLFFWNYVLVFSYNKMQLISSCFILPFYFKVTETMRTQLLGADNASLRQGTSAAKAAVSGYHISQAGKVPATTIFLARPL